MFSKTLATLALSVLTTRIFAVTTVAPNTGNNDAINACLGFPTGAVKCLSDISYTICRAEGDGHGSEQLYFVSAGTHCEQGIPGQKIDVANVPGVATATRSFAQHSIGGETMRTPLTMSYDDEQKASWFLTTATAGMPYATSIMW